MKVGGKNATVHTTFHSTKPERRDRIAAGLLSRDVNFNTLALSFPRDYRNSGFKLEYKESRVKTFFWLIEVNRIGKGRWCLGE